MKHGRVFELLGTLMILAGIVSGMAGGGGAGWLIGLGFLAFLIGRFLE